jgi:hypothetical protein
MKPGPLDHASDIMINLIQLPEFDRCIRISAASTIPYGTDGLGGRGCTRMRLKLRLSVLGHAFRVTGTGVMALPVRHN